MSDPECYQFFAHPRVSETEIVNEARGGEESENGSEALPLGMEVLEAALTMRARGLMGACYCFPVEVRCGGLGLGWVVVVVINRLYQPINHQRMHLTVHTQRLPLLFPPNTRIAAADRGEVLRGAGEAAADLPRAAAGLREDPHLHLRYNAVQALAS